MAKSNRRGVRQRSSKALVSLHPTRPVETYSIGLSSAEVARVISMREWAKLCRHIDCSYSGLIVKRIDFRVLKIVRDSKRFLVYAWVSGKVRRAVWFDCLDIADEVKKS